MKIIVSNEAEKDLVQRLLNVMHEFDILDYIHEETTKEPGVLDGSDNIDDFVIWADEAKILREEIFDTHIEIDETLSDIKVDGELITGTCRFCGLETIGIGEDCEGSTYEDYVDYKSEEKQKDWSCTECHGRICGCCGEKLVDDADENDCADCLAEESGGATHAG